MGKFTADNNVGGPLPEGLFQEISRRREILLQFQHSAIKQKQIGIVRRAQKQKRPGVLDPACIHQRRQLLFQAPIRRRRAARCGHAKKR